MPLASNPIKDLGRSERGIEIRHRRVQRKLVPLDELQRGYRSDQLDHGGDAKAPYRAVMAGPLGKAAPAENALVDDAIIGRGQAPRLPAHSPALVAALEHGIDVGKCSGGKPGRSPGRAQIGRRLTPAAPMAARPSPSL